MTAMQELQKWVDDTYPNFNKSDIEEKIDDLIFKERQQIMDAYNAGYRDGEQDAGNPPPHKKDISQFSNAADYFSTIFTDNADSQR